MKLNRTGSNWTELERNKINENWSIIEGLGDSIGKVVTGLVWKTPVDTAADLPTNAEVGETRMVREADPDGISYVYRYDGEKWEKIQEIDVTLVNEVDRRLTMELERIDDVKASKEEMYRESNAKADKSYVDSKVADVDSRIDGIITNPAVGVSEQEIIDSREGKDSLGENIRDIRDKTKVNIVNEIENGNFSKEGLSGFFTNLGTTENIDGVAVTTSTGTGRDGGRLSKRIADEVPQNEVWYFKAKVRTTDTGCNWIALGVRATSGASASRVNTPVKDRWYTVSHYMDVEDFEGVSGNASLSIYSYWPAASGKKVETDDVMAINLTKAFGRGNEPSKEFMDDLIDKFPYFEGDIGAGKIHNLLLKKDFIIEKGLKEVKESELENIITNGDFADGTSGWTAASGTIMNVANEWVTIKGDGGHPIPRIFQRIETDYSVGDVLYITADFLPLNNDVDRVGFAVYSDLDGNSDISYFTIDVTENQVARVSTTVNVASAVGDMRVQVRTVYGSSALANGKEVNVTGIKVYNLTKFFGEGNEPGADSFAKMLSVMPSANESKKTNVAETQKALTQFILGRTTVSSKSESPLAVVSFDDQNLSDYDKAFPFLRARGIKGTSYIITSRVGDPGKMDWHHLHELKDAGWGIECHTDTHPNLNNATDQEIRQEMEAVNQKFIQNGLAKPRHIALPYGAGYNNERVQNVLSEYRKTIRNSQGRNNLYNDINFLRMYGLSVDMNEHRQDRIPG